MKVFILGINGFIGYHLYKSIIEKTDWFIYGFDIADDKIKTHSVSDRLEFFKGDIRKEQNQIEEYIKQSNVVVPLVAIATPALYIKEPIKVYELDFEENIKIVKLCVKHKKRIVFPSTSEVYGMSEDSEFDEDVSNLLVGPICKQRWIYSACKQLIDRVIWAYGLKENLNFTLFRPFNWVGPHLDNVNSPEDGKSRVVTQFISNILHNKPIKLVNGGKQKRCFTYIDDGIDCLLKILENKNNCADKQIFNIGNPDNNYTIEFIAEYIVKWVKNNRPDLKIPDIIYVSDKNYYGEGFEDIGYRVPNISKAKNILKWTPEVIIEDLLGKTLSFYLKDK